MTKIFTNIGELVTWGPLTRENRYTQIQESDLGLQQSCWLAVENGKVLSSGSMPVPEKFQNCSQIDLGHSLVMPGLVDPHTHPLFAGSRANEFSLKLQGQSYQQIAKMGGGISSTISQTRRATSSELLALCEKRLKKSLSNGVTTLEVKTGYGQSVQEELRHLEIYQQIRSRVSQKIYITCLALHALPPEFKTNTDYIDHMTKNLLPKLKSENLAEAVDLFIENAYFLPDEVKDYLSTARRLGLDIRVHADEFSDAKAAMLAAEFGAKSADHLQFASDEGIAAMAATGVTAILLPGTSLYSGIKFTNAKNFVAQNCKLAIGTDFNPGSCRIDDLPFLSAVATIHCGLSIPQALAAISIVAAESLGLEQTKGALEPGFDADFIVVDCPSLQEWYYDFCQLKPHKVWIKDRFEIG